MIFDFRNIATPTEGAPEAAPVFDAEKIMLGADATNGNATPTAPDSEATANESAPNIGPGAAPDLSVSDANGVKGKRRGRPRKVDAQTAQVEAAMANFFSPDGIGALWVQGWDAFFNVCGAEPLAAEMKGFHAAVFATWAKHRLPQTPDKYQPDMMLLASVGMMALPRLQPIAKTTAPMWKRAGTGVVSLFRKLFKGR